MTQLLKLAIELGPLIIFFFTNARFGIFAATAAFMAATAIALTLSWLIYRRVAAMPLITGVFVLIFGGLTLYLQNETFIKMKPTIVNLLFAAVLLGGLAFGRSFFKLLFDEVFHLDDTGWRKLTLRWGVFFVLLAGLNEFVWRTFSTDIWVSFKVFGIMPLTFAFAMMQIGLLQKHQQDPGAKDAAGTAAGAFSERAGHDTSS